MSSIYITNNPLIVQKLSEDHIIEFYDLSYVNILEITRDKIHLGYKLLTHPLSGSIKPNETPYKTTIISGKRSYFDMDSLYIIEDCIQTAKKFLRDSTVTNWSQEALKDLQYIDHSLFSMDRF